MKRILLVEDNRGDQRLVEEALKGSVPLEDLQFVGDGELALKLMRQAAQTQSLPELILLDLSLPRMSGHELLEILKRDRRFKHIPVIIFTSSELPRDIARCYACGANCYLVKPSGIDGYFSTLHAVRDFWLQHARLPRSEEDTEPAKQTEADKQSQK